jgi:C_GCAxxG_C_C family probable redox protein
MSKQGELALQCFTGGFSCSQAVFSTYCEGLGLDKETALKISGAFGGGMGHIGETCGAVTGAFMVIGLKYGKYRVEDNTAKEETYRKVQEFAKRFRTEFGSLRCQDLITYDLRLDEEVNKAREAGVFKTICPKLVKRAAELVEKIL